ncbi:hypothetical protein EYF80_027379 [Liparis tanakae]|uniref:Uncharacterized protein n=1 Tax=Liparis tanakae TaxID=230148 RepID=A0A4Z2H910_9TELE|nr:hypothetical protein EYF80_027379 [Liparis tanakae]
MRPCGHVTPSYEMQHIVPCQQEDVQHFPRQPPGSPTRAAHPQGLQALRGLFIEAPLPIPSAGSRDDCVTPTQSYSRSTSTIVFLILFLPSATGSSSLQVRVEWFVSAPYPLFNPVNAHNAPTGFTLGARPCSRSVAHESETCNPSPVLSSDLAGVLTRFSLRTEVRKGHGRERERENVREGTRERGRTQNGGVAWS